jgi:hypothetical protein
MTVRTPAYRLHTARGLAVVTLASKDHNPGPRRTATSRAAGRPVRLLA